jgi:nicotinamidase-related amidase
LASEIRPQLGPSDALLAVDVQRDFCLGGALAVPDGDRMMGAFPFELRTLEPIGWSYPVDISQGIATKLERLRDA